MKKLKNLCRLLSTVLAMSLIIVGTNLTAFANESVDVEESLEETSYMDNEVVHISADGEISYEIISTTYEETVAYSDDGIVMINDTSSGSQSDDVMATASSTGLQDVSLSFVNFSPYRNMCVIRSTFPNGTIMESSGILISKNLVLTSAHGVYDHENGGAAKNVTIGLGTYFTGSEKVVQSGTQNWKAAYLKRGWTENQLCKYDWALVELSQHTLTYEKCGYVPDISKAKGKAIRLIGYLVTKGVGATAFKYSTGEITGTTNFITTPEQIKDTWKLSANTIGGMSGGPIIEHSNGVVIGVIKGAYTNYFGWETPAGVPLTQEAADTIKQYAVW